MSSTTTSFNFSGTDITMTCSPVKKKVEFEDLMALVPQAIKKKEIEAEIEEYSSKIKKWFDEAKENYGVEDSDASYMEMLDTLIARPSTMKDWMIDEGWKFVDDEDGNTTAVFE